MMQIVKVFDKSTNQLLKLPLDWPAEIKSDTLHYFVQGHGWKKSKKFLVEDAPELPNQWPNNLDWFDIGRVVNDYGLDVAEYYANHMTAGITARQTARWYGASYAAIKDLIPKVDDEQRLRFFFKLMPADYMCNCFGLVLFDVCQADINLSKADPSYNNINLTYKGESNISMSEYVRRAYGEVYVEMIDRLIGINTND